MPKLGGWLIIFVGCLMLFSQFAQNNYSFKYALVGWKEMLIPLVLRMVTIKDISDAFHSMHTELFR